MKNVVEKELDLPDLDLDLELEEQRAPRAYPGKKTRLSALGQTTTTPGKVAPTMFLAPVMRKADGNQISDDAAVRLARAEGASGSPLPPALLAELEAALGRSLDHVRVHTDATADAAARAVSARAFARDQDIFFASGEFSPDSPSGKQLIAHEVAHTIQAHGSTSHALDVSRPGDAHEREADSFAAAFASPAKATPVAVSPGSGGAAVKRDGGPTTDEAETPAEEPERRGSVNWRAYRVNTPRYRCELQIGVEPDSGETAERGLEAEPNASRGTPSVTAGATNGAGSFAAGVSLSAVHSDLATLTVGPNLNFQVDMELFEGSLSTDGGLDMNLAVVWVSVNGYVRAQDAEAIRAAGHDGAAILPILEAGNRVRIRGRVGVKVPLSDLRHLQSMSTSMRAMEAAQAEATAARQSARALERQAQGLQRQMRDARRFRSGSRAARAAQARNQALRTQRRSLLRRAASQRQAASAAQRRAGDAATRMARSQQGLSSRIGRRVGERLARRSFTRMGAAATRQLLRFLGPVAAVYSAFEIARTLYDIGRGAMAFGPGVDGADEAADNPADDLEHAGSEDREDADGGEGDGENGGADTGTDAAVEEGTSEEATGGTATESESESEAGPGRDSQEEPESQESPDSENAEEGPGIGNPMTEALRATRRQRYGAFIERAMQHNRSWYFEPARDAEGAAPTAPARGQRMNGLLALFQGAGYVAGTVTITIMDVSASGAATRIRHPRFDAADASGQLLEVPAGVESRSTE